jgi:hypothetical protein
MQFNTTAALTTALISAVIGFGLAFFIERKLNSLMQKKSQKILTYIAMTSFGYGLMATLNELIGFPLQGLHIRYDKLAGYVFANMLFFPIVLLVIAKLISLKNQSVNADLSVNSNPVAANFFKYFLMLAGALSVAYFGYVAIDAGTSPSAATYDFYFKEDSKNCNSPFEEKAGMSLKFLFKKETNEIFMTSEINNNGTKKQQIQKLDSCSVLDSENWKCGGEWTGNYQSPTYMFINGDFAYDKGFNRVDANCDLRFVKR